MKKGHHQVFFDAEAEKLKQANRLLQQHIGVTNRPGNNPTEKQLALDAARAELYRQAKAGLLPRQKQAERKKTGVESSRDLLIDAAVKYLLAEREVVESPIDGKGIHAENFTNNVLGEVEWSELVTKDKVPSKRTARRILNDSRTRFLIYMRYREALKD